MSENLSPGNIIGRDFRVVQRLAAGGMGTVYEAVQISTGKRRALKLMHAQYEGDERTRQRFIHEAQATASIDSDHIVEMVAAGIDEETNTPWIVMELLQGTDLRAALQQKKRFTQAETLEVFRQLCHGLGAAHHKGLVHRDLKPENIFLAVPRREGIPFTVKILDFGLAKLVAGSSGMVSSTQPVGSPRWMAPEQAEVDGSISAPTDVWAMGLLAFFLLTGRFYWKSANSASSTIMQQMCEVLMDPLETASERAAKLGVHQYLPEGFDAWFARCVDRLPENRYSDASEAMAAFAPLLHNAATDPPPTADLAGRRRLSSRPAPRMTPNDLEPLPRDDSAQELPFTLDGPVRSDTAAMMVSSPPVTEARPWTRVAGYVAIGLLSCLGFAAIIAAVVKHQNEPTVATLHATPSEPPTPSVAPSEPAVAPSVVVAPSEPAVAPSVVVAPSEPVVAPSVVAAPSVAVHPSVAPSTAGRVVGRVVPSAAPSAAASAVVGSSITAVSNHNFAVLDGHRLDFQSCFERASEGHAHVSGSLELRFTIDDNGRAQDLSAHGFDDLSDLRPCLFDTVRAVTFQLPPAGTREMRYQLRFRGSEPTPTPAANPPTNPGGPTQEGAPQGVTFTPTPTP